MNAARRRAAVCLGCASLAACTVGPRYVAPEVSRASSGGFVANDGQVATDESPPDAWWQLYDDPQLDRWVKSALIANTDVRVAEAQLEAAVELSRTVHATIYPATNLAVGATYGRDPITNEILTVAGARPPVQWTDSLDFSLSYDLDLFGQRRRAIESARAQAGVAAGLRDSARVLAAALTTRAYADLCNLGEQLDVARRSLDIAQSQLAIARRDEAAGGASHFDVARAAVIEAQTRAAIPAIEGRRQSALFELAALTGRPPSQAPSELLSCKTVPLLRALIPVGDGAQLLARRPDVRTAERRLAASTADIGIETAELYPHIRLGASYGSIATSVGGLKRYDSINWGVGPLISWSFPNVAVARARIAAARAQAREALAAFDGAVLQALKETEQALAVYASEIERHAALVEAEAQALDAFTLSHGQQSAGSASRLDVLTAEQTLLGAAANRASSDGLLIDDQIAVFRALGGGWGAATP